MTRRIAITILVTVWSAIVIAGSAAWGVAYYVMLSELDLSVVSLVWAGPIGSTAGNGPERIARANRVAPVLVILEKKFVSTPQGEYRQLWYRDADGAQKMVELPT